MVQLIVIMILSVSLLITNGAVTPALGGGAAGIEKLDQLISQALERNPDLKATEARWQSFTHKIVQASSLDDPRLSLALNNFPVDDFSADKTPMTGEMISLSQTLPFPGKLATKKEIATQQLIAEMTFKRDKKERGVRPIPSRMNYPAASYGVNPKKD